MNLELSLKKWCDDNLKPGKCYMGDENGPITEKFNYRYNKNKKEKEGRLVYQDGTACFASHAFHDVYLLDDGSYTVYTDCGSDCGGGHNYDIESQNFCGLAEVLDFLTGFCGHDNNITGDFYEHMRDNFELVLTEEQKQEWKRETHIPILAKCGNNESIIKAISEAKLEPYWWQK